VLGLKCKKSSLVAFEREPANIAPNLSQTIGIGSQRVHAIAIDIDILKTEVSYERSIGISEEIAK
jgi:hypothetical protein